MEYQTYNDQSNSSQDRHENGTSISKRQSVELDKWLGCKQSEKRVKVGGAVEEYDHRQKATDASCDGTREETTSGDDARKGMLRTRDPVLRVEYQVPGILCLLRNMANSIETGESTSRKEAINSSVNRSSCRQFQLAHNDKIQFHPGGAPVPLSAFLFISLFR